MPATLPPTPTAPSTAPGRAGFYERRVLPKVLDVIMDTKETRRIRTEVCAPLEGEVLEIGFGTGHNLPFLPPAVTRVLAVDPMERGQVLAAERIATATAEVQLVGLDGQALPLDDASIATVLCTWTLCSVPDPTAAVQEIVRVLEPGGTLHFVEHGLSPDPGVSRWQRRLTGLQQRIAGGCSLDRDIVALLEAGGLRITELATFYAKGDPKLLGWTTQGRATHR